MRALAYNLGNSAEKNDLTVLADSIFEIMSSAGIGEQDVQNIANGIGLTPEEFYGGFETTKLRINRYFSCSAPCATEIQFQDQRTSLGLVEGPWFVSGNTYLTGNGHLVVGANPLDLTTPQPVFIFVDHSNPIVSGDGAIEATKFFLSAKATELVSSALLVLPARTVKIMQEGWYGTELQFSLEEILAAFKNSVFNRMAQAVMGILFPHFYTLTSGLTAVTPLQAFGCTIGQHVVSLYRHYDPGSVYATGDSSDEITNLVLDFVSTGKFFLAVSAGCSDVSQKDLRDPSSMYLYTERSLVSVSLRVRMDAIMKQGTYSHARALVLALKKLSDQQASIILQRGMQTANLLLQLNQCAAAGATPLNESINAIRSSLGRLPYPVFIPVITSCYSALVVDPSTLSIGVFVAILASESSKKTTPTNLVSHCLYTGSDLKRARLSGLGGTEGSSCPTSCALDHFVLHTVADQPTFEEYTASIYNVLTAVDANRSILASKFCYAFISGKCNKGVDCPFPHVSAEKISACVRAILASGGSLTPIYIPSNVLQQLVTKEEMLQYFQLKKQVQMKAKSMRGHQEGQGGGLSAGGNFQGSTHRNPAPLRELPSRPPLTSNPPPQALSPPSSSPPELGIPLASSHPPNCSTVTFGPASDLESLWQSDSSVFFLAAVVGRDNDPLLGICYTVSNGIVTGKEPLDACTSPRASLVKNLFTWLDLRSLDPVMACGSLSLPTHFVGVSSDLEPSVAILKLVDRNTCASPLACTASALPDSGANLTLANGSYFNPKGSLHHFVKFLVPLDSLGKFEVKGVDGGRSTIRSICWIEIPIMVRSNGASSGAPQIMIMMGFNAFLIDMNNPNAIIFGNKTLGALGCHIVPHFVSDNKRSPSSQLRPYENPLPFRLALHPFLEDAARKTILSESTSEEMKSSLSSLIRMNGLAPL